MTEQVHGTGAPKTHHNTVKNDVTPSATDRSNTQSRMAVPVYGGCPTGPLYLAKCAVGLWADPAIVIAVAFMCGKMCIRTGWGFPRPVAVLLQEHVARGDVSAGLVVKWLQQNEVRLPEPVTVFHYGGPERAPPPSVTTHPSTGGHDA